jgi:ribosomal protein S18 acetylase RimI-like enzyme
MPDAAVVESAESIIALFPSFAPMNNAIVLSPHEADLERERDRAADAYRSAAVSSWALWVPSCTATFDGEDEGLQIAGMKRDETTLVMKGSVGATRRTWRAARRVSTSIANRAGDEPVPIEDLGEPEPRGAMAGWVAVDGEVAVAGATSFLHGPECGIYAVGTAPSWRRRGIARRLVEHALADAAQRGARTATLQSTPMGHRLYELLGFEAVGRYEEWVPA